MIMGKLVAFGVYCGDLLAAVIERYHDESGGTVWSMFQNVY